MLFTAVAVVGGLVLGMLLGGRPSNLANATLRWPLALLGGVVLQWVPELLGAGENESFVLVAASYIALALFAAVNIRLVGMPIVVVGLALNALVIGLNGGMPVRAEAVVAAGLADDAGEVESLDFGAKRHLETRDDLVPILGDVLPVEPLGEVLSFGDLVLSAGVGNLLFRLVRPARSRRRASSSHLGELDDGIVIDLRTPAPTTRASRVAS